MNAVFGEFARDYLKWPGSLICFDLNGGETPCTIDARGDGWSGNPGMGQKVCDINPHRSIHDRYACQFNPLGELNPEDASACINKVSLIAHSMIVNQIVSSTGDDAPPRDLSIYTEPTLSFALKAMEFLILHVVTSRQFEGRRNLGTIRHLIMRGDKEAERVLGQEREVDPSPFSDAADLLWAMMATNESLDGYIAESTRNLLSERENNMAGWRLVHQILQESTQHFKEDWNGRSQIDLQCERSDFRLSELRTSPQGLTLLISLKEPDVACYWEWLQMVLNLIIWEITQPGRNRYPIKIVVPFENPENHPLFQPRWGDLQACGVNVVTGEYTIRN